MKSLYGRAYFSGAIEFPFAVNEWAHKWLRSQLSKRQSGGNRIVVDPKKFDLEVSTSEDVSEDLFWLARVKELIRTADQIYLTATDKSFRFQRAIHAIDDNRQVITLGNQNEIEKFAVKHWSNIKYFYAYRDDEFNFNLKKLVTCREGYRPTDTIELTTRVYRKAGESIGHLTFLATGSGTPGEIIEWRGTVEVGQLARFSPEDMVIRCVVTQARQPLTLLREYREEFKNYAYELEGDQLTSLLEKLQHRNAKTA